MTQKDEQPLLIDICGRLPYGVKGLNNANQVIPLNFKTQYKMLDGIRLAITKYGWRPYLFPLSSMTSKQRAELSMLTADSERMFDSVLIEIDFYHKHHIDYRGLIEKGLAIDATGLNIY